MKNILKMTAVLASAFTMLSCTVKEERDGCPCWLDINVSSCSRHSDVVYLKGTHEGTQVIGDKVYLSDFPDIYEKEVPRGMIEYSAFCGINTSLLSGDSVIIPEGNQSDRLYAYKTTVWADGENAYDEIVPHKQFATVTVKINEKAGYNTGITISGETAGFNVVEMCPVAGEFTYSAEQDDNGTIVFRLPRQMNKELLMSLERNNSTFNVIQLGDLITQTGYDWSATDLEDVYININTTDMDSPIHVEIWREGQNYDYYI